jgi:hypothetical protein
MNDVILTKYVILLGTRNPERARSFLMNPDMNFTIIELLQMKQTAEKLRAVRVLPVLSEVINTRINEFIN